MNDNIVIAEYMGNEFNPEGDHTRVLRLAKDYSCMKFHTSWDWLIPVVEKIESNDNSFVIGDKWCAINDTEHTGHSKFAAVYDAVVSFLKFSREQGEW